MKQATSNRRTKSLDITQGTRVMGKWNQEKYYVLRKLGEGMVGTVFLCRSKGKFVALKISTQGLSMTTEVNVLKALDKVQDVQIGPRLLDVDDWESASGQMYSFYVMEYIKGVALEKYIKTSGHEWVGIFLIQMLDQLEALHQTGWIFGDLKNDNLLVTKHPSTVRFVDVGGTTRIGRSVKEYSEYYDRGYWSLGSRIAEPSYDLFSLAMVMLRSYHLAPLAKTPSPARYLCRKLADVNELGLYKVSLAHAINGRFKTAAEMKSDILYRLVKGREPKKQGKRPIRAMEPVILLGVTAIYGVITYLFF